MATFVQGCSSFRRAASRGGDHTHPPIEHKDGVLCNGLTAVPPLYRSAEVGETVYLRWSAIPACDRLTISALRIVKGKIVEKSHDHRLAFAVAFDGRPAEWFQAEHLSRIPEVFI